MRTLVSALAAGAAVAWLAAGSGGAGGGKGGPFKPILPAEAYKELVGRAAKAVEEGIDRKSEDSLKRAQVEAVRVAVYTLCTKEGGGSAARQAALKAAEMVRDKKDLAKAKQLAASLPGMKTGGEAPGAAPVFTKYLEDVSELMNLYRPRAKGGEGIAPALQASEPLRKQNGIEEKVRYLGRKALKPAVMNKESKELELLGYKIATDGALTAAFAASQKDGARQWLEFAEAQRDEGTRLAEAARAKDAAGVHKAAEALERSCTQCHKKFRAGG
jgi:hypothetical protein